MNCSVIMYKSLHVVNATDSYRLLVSGIFWSVQLVMPWFHKSELKFKSKYMISGLSLALPPLSQGGKGLVTLYYACM